ncbi:hypothetical protein K1719_031295 [Acacia pycnantha]|nr:hypothetical protein K1719_031295 [Acacia pycnantha]
MMSKAMMALQEKGVSPPVEDDSLRSTKKVRLRLSGGGREDGVDPRPSERLNSTKRTSLLAKRRHSAISFYDAIRATLSKGMERALIIKLLGRSITFYEVRARTRALWQLKGSFQLVDMEGSYFFATFDLEEDYVKALTGGPWMIFGAYLTVQPWSLDFDAKSSPISKVVAWERCKNTGNRTATALYHGGYPLPRPTGALLPVHLEKSALVEVSPESTTERYGAWMQVRRMCGADPEEWGVILVLTHCSRVEIRGDITQSSRSLGVGSGRKKTYGLGKAQNVGSHKPWTHNGPTHSSVRKKEVKVISPDATPTIPVVTSDQSCGPTIEPRKSGIGGKGNKEIVDSGVIPG